MGSPTSVTTENPEPHRRGGASYSKATPTAAIDDIEEAYSDNNERPSRGPWPSEAPPTGLPMGMLGEMALCYEACWRHYRSARRQGKA
jgi:hypothetical protein